MVTDSKVQDEHIIVVRPNRSANWSTNRLLITVFGIWYAVVGLAFAAAGAWLILPLAGLELLLFAGALYTVCWRLQIRHVLRFGKQELKVEKGVRHSAHSWQLPRDTVSLSVEQQRHPWDPVKLFVCGPRDRVPVGDFLNREDSLLLLEKLRGQGLAVRNYSSESKLRV